MFWYTGHVRNLRFGPVYTVGNAEYTWPCTTVIELHNSRLPIKVLPIKPMLLYDNIICTKMVLVIQWALWELCTQHTKHDSNMHFPWV